MLLSLCVWTTMVIDVNMVMHDNAYIILGFYVTLHVQWVTRALVYDALPSSLMDSTTSPKVDTTKGERVKVALRGQRDMLELQDGTRKIHKKSTTQMDLHKPNQTTSQLMHSQNTLVHERARGKHRFTRLMMAQTWEKPPPSPL